MAYRTMKDLLKATCDAIRLRDGTTASINHQDIPARIEAIEAIEGGNTEVSNISELYCWEKYETNNEVSDPYKVQEEKISSVVISKYGKVWHEDSASWSGECYFSDDYIVKNGEIKLVNSSKTNIYPDNTNELIGKCVQIVYGDSGYYKFTDETTFRTEYYGTDIGYIYADNAIKLSVVDTGIGDLIGYVISDNKSNYPENGRKNGFAYSYYCTLGNTTKHVWNYESASLGLEDSDAAMLAACYGDVSTIRINYVDSIDSVRVVDGEAVLSSPLYKDFYHHTNANHSKNDYSVLKGKYVESYAGGVYYIKNDSSVYYTENPGTYVNATIGASNVQKIVVSSAESGYVMDAKRDAYPDSGKLDGIYYDYKGELSSLSMGDAQPSDVVSGVTFSSEHGFQKVGTHSCEGGSTSEPVIKSLTITSNGTYTAPSGVDGYSPITVNVASSGTSTGETPTPVITVSSSGLITATAGTKSATKQLSVSDDSDFKAANIKSGVNIFGIAGTLSESSGDGSQNDGSIEASSLSDVHYWTKTGSTGTTGYSYEEVYNKNGATLGYVNNSVQYADDITLSGDSLMLINPKKYTITTNKDDAEAVLIGKYVYALNVFHRIPSDAKIIYDEPTQYNSGSIRATKTYRINVISGTELEQTSTVVISTDSSAYPENGEQNGFTYVYQGTLGG